MILKNEQNFTEKGVGVYKTQGIILKKTELSDTDRLLTVYTQSAGKILVRAKGIGKKESKLKSLTEPFNLCEFMLAKSKTMDVLAGVYPIKEFSYLHNNLSSLAYAFYFAELIDKMVAAPERDDNLWRLILRAFEVLNQKRDDLPKIKTLFEQKLLEFLGHGKPTKKTALEIIRELVGERIQTEKFLHQ